MTSPATPTDKPSDKLERLIPLIRPGHAATTDSPPKAPITDGGLCQTYWRDGLFDLWFSDATHHDAVAAQNICSECPLLQGCMTHALRYETHGVWGLTVSQRAALGGVITRTQRSTIKPVRRARKAVAQALEAGIPEKVLIAALVAAVAVDHPDLPRNTHPIWNPRPSLEKITATHLPVITGRILTALATGPTTIEQLHQRTGIDETALRRLLGDRTLTDASGKQVIQVNLTDMGLTVEEEETWRLRRPLADVDWDNLMNTAYAEESDPHVIVAAA
jgi:hypothetical protein